MRNLFALLLVALSPLVAAAADPVIGQRVFTKPGAEAKTGDTKVDITKIPFPAAVGDVKGDWVWLERAWVRKSDVMSTQEALEYFTEQIRRKPAESSGWSNRGGVWAEKGEFDNAIKDFTEAIRLDPNGRAAYSNRGNAWQDKREFDNAINDFTEAIRLDPKCSMAYNNRGLIWHENKRELEIAFKDYNEAIRLDPNNVCAYFNRGNAWQDKREFDNAIRDYTEAVRLDPKYLGAFYNRGIAREEKNELDNALSDYNQANSLDPKHPIPYNGIAWLKATCPDQRFRDGKAAVEYATKACELTAWKSFNHLDTLAAAYAEAGNFEKAVEFQAKALAGASVTDKAEYQAHLDLFKSGKPFRDEPKK